MIQRHLHPSVVRLLSRCLVAAALLLGCLAPATQPVYADGPLQTLITNALPNSTVHFPAGTFTENLTVNKNLTLAGDPGGGTILQPPTGAPGITLGAGASSSTIQDITITGADNTEPDGTGAGGALLVTNATTIVQRCAFSNNSAETGGAIFQDGGSLSVYDSTFQNNHVEVDGGAIFSKDNLTLSNTRFIGNSAGRHGGGAHGNSSVSMIGGSFEDNTAGENGGGLNLNNDLYISGTSFKNNSAGSDGGGVLQWNANMSVMLFNAAFSDNTAANTGGGMAAKGNMVVTRGSFLRNIAGETSKAENSSGGGLYLEGGSLDLTGTTFQENEVRCTGCSIREGGGLLVANPAPVINHVRDAHFVGNNGWFGGGLLQTKRDSDTTYGSLTLERSTFTDNEAGYGGGAYGINVTARDCLFYGNHAVNSGGGLEVAGDSLLERLRVIHNSSSFAAGGGILLTGSATILNSVFIDNFHPTGSASGSAIYQHSGTMTFQHVTLSHNTGGDGTGFYIDGGSVDMTNAIVATHTVGVCVKAGSANIDGVLWSGNISTVGSGVTGCNVAPAVAHPHNGSPAFASDGYHITSASAAVDAGEATSLTDDIDGDHRPKDGFYDLGADELYFRVWLPSLRK